MTILYARASAWGRRLRRGGLAVLLAGGAALSASAQNLYYTTTSATNVAGTYTDLGATGTAIATANTDDANSAAQNIGFTFAYGSTSFTQFVLNTNGFLKLGATAPSAAAMYLDEARSSAIIDPFQSANDANIIAPLNVDLTAGTAGGTEYRVATTGTAPNRVCTIQWKNVLDKASMRPTQYNNLSFQVRLYETTNVIELVYGPATASTGAVSFRLAQVGLKGTGFASGQLVQVEKNPGTSWAGATFSEFSAVATSGYLNVFAISNAALPDAGRTYRFAPAPPTDVAVRTIYTLGELPTPAALPHVVQAVVTNNGYQTLTNVPVTLSVTGANTFNDTQTVASLAPGVSVTVSFAAYPATLNTGTNTLTATATVTGDSNAANNSATFSQVVTTDRITYLDQTSGFSYFNVDTTKAGGVQATKFTLTQIATLTNATVLLAGVSKGTTKPVTFKVVVYAADGTNGAPGTVLYTSPDQNRPAKAGAVAVSLGNTAVPAGSFFIGVQETSPGGAGLLLQEEDPPRPLTSYLTFDGSTWLDLSDYGIGFRYAIEVQLGAAPTCNASSPITSFPYNQTFDLVLSGQSLPCGITVLDANRDNATWALTTTTPYSGTRAMRYTSALSNSVAADDWFFTPALTTAANTRYQVAFRYRGEGIAPANSSYTEKLEVKVGPSATPAGQTTTLYTNTAITNTTYALANDTSTPAVAVFTPGAGTQYVGFHVFSAANQGNLYIDNLSITASVVTATSSAALLRAVTVFPNPSTNGLFDLEVHGAQAKGALGVVITNNLGQLVYTGAARDNYTNRLDLSGLAPGIYHLQVRNGDETMTRQLAIVK